MIQEQLAKRLETSLHVSDSVAGGDDAQPVVSPNGESAVNVDEDASSDDDKYNPAPEYLLHPPPRRNKKKATTKGSNPKLVLDRNFLEIKEDRWG